MRDHTHDGHRKRLKERYEATGADGFSDHEILELLLGYALAQKDTNPLAHQLVDTFGNLQGVLDADKEELLKQEQMGDHATFLLKFMPCIVRRYCEQKTADILRLLEPQELIDFFLARMIDRKQECVMAAFLDGGKRLLSCKVLYEGNAHMVEVNNERILKEAIRINSKYVILAHNHFTNCTPSIQDVGTSQAVQKKLLTFGITLLDHIVICGGQGSSMVETGHFIPIYAEDVKF